MQVVVTRSGVTRVADVSDGVSAMKYFTNFHTVRVVIKVSVVVDGPIVRVQLIDRYSAGLAKKQLYNRTVRRGKDRSVLWRRDVDCIVRTSFRPRGGKCVLQLFRSDTGNRNQKLSR